jgi:hypothetical protein
VNADPDDAARPVTTVVRGEGFTDGQGGPGIEDGRLPAAARRVGDGR